ncbi:uncharacterized protein LOC132760140 [Ruditapes philippinarum]|uniref:uncharacterized protein LOC132760140 n=1 Tax=Ruditapes philippinarum TaxID=129788 RepID=UPI00295B87C9|nr:uncharacterized protein LOC132760140 [Ruditapes philippinarum]
MVGKLCWNDRVSSRFAVVIVLHLCQHIGSSFPPNPEPGSVTPWANNSTSPGNTQSTTFLTGGFIPNVRQPGPDPGRLPGDNNDDQAYYSTTGSSQAYGSTTMYFISTESRSSISTESMSSKFIKELVYVYDPYTKP